ncbi:PREDICTED: stimulator of interferon genes protein isoform X1 [Calidris pugnax]|uniref:stimulator of interferon genes protein isoform X1 n=1 Tax=Calidris pugnax TaxID=198806 RepID=UPI00071D2A0F|nr:PREDICTED: stimulator of interferon genes protein isoform X1 [Calidris pugnax]
MSQESWRPGHATALLIPRPRGGRARVATFLLLALCATALYLAGEPLLPAARSLTFHFLALEIRALLKGICYLAEEIFHLQSRHRGSFWRALSACFSLHWHGPMLLVCGSAYVALLHGDEQPLGLHLGLASLCELLVLALGLQQPSAVEMSEMSERSKQNVAHGLAWSYYVGYLKIVLPRVKKAMEEFSRANPNVPACRETWKLHILVPLSCDIYDDLEKADSNIQYLTDLSETTLTRAGTKKRVYKHSLYMIRDEDKLWPCVVEYATPLQSLYAMSQDECAAFSREDRLEQAKLFYRTLEEILKGSKECAGTYRLIAYQELGEAETHSLSREILWHLREQRHEYVVYEKNQPHNPSTTLNSTELDLQISGSDLPQPLRSDGF